MADFTEQRAENEMGSCCRCVQNQFITSKEEQYHDQRSESLDVFFFCQFVLDRNKSCESISKDLSCDIKKLLKRVQNVDLFVKTGGQLTRSNLATNKDVEMHD